MSSEIPLSPWGNRQIKKGSRDYLPTAPLAGTKKGKSIPYIIREHFCLVIFSTIVSSSWWLPTAEGKTYPISNRAVIALFLLSTPSSVFSVARTPLALPLVD